MYGSLEYSMSRSGGPSPAALLKDLPTAELAVVSGLMDSNQPFGRSRSVVVVRAGSLTLVTAPPLDQATNVVPSVVLDRHAGDLRSSLRAGAQSS
jgi:hypothetical protein